MDWPRCGHQGIAIGAATTAAACTGEPPSSSRGQFVAAARGLHRPLWPAVRGHITHLFILFFHIYLKVGAFGP
jgi:hypothetical protein